MHTTANKKKPKNKNNDESKEEQDENKEFESIKKLDSSVDVEKGLEMLEIAE